jgi:hypothetical protein
VAQAHLTRIGSALKAFLCAVRFGTCGIRAALFRGRFDAQLAGGADPQSDPAVARARQLTRRRYRRRLAASVQRLVEDLDADPGSYVTSAVPFRLDQVAEARGTLLSVAGALRDVEQVDPRGVAMTLRLITDPTSPLYVPAAGGTLRLRAQAALRRLLAQSQPWCDLPEVPSLPVNEDSNGHR